MTHPVNPIFPAEAYDESFIQQLLHRLYKLGHIPTRDENLFLLSLKSHPRTVSIATQLLRAENESFVHQFAANLLTQSLELETNCTEEAADQIISIAAQNSMHYGNEPAGQKVRRQLMIALGMALRPLLNWRTKFDALVLAVQPDFFRSMEPDPRALDAFYVFVKFGLRKYGGGEVAFRLVVEYFLHLLARHFEVFDARQAIYLKFLADWLKDVENFETPNAEVGALMVLVAKYVDCPERQTMPWSAVQTEAAAALEVCLGLTDLHLLQNSVIELLQVIIAFPIIHRARTLPEPQAELYLDTTVKVFLHFTLEFADVVIACSEDPATAHILGTFVERLQLLADPFPQRECTAPLEELFSRNAVTAFSELSSLLFQMCGKGSDVAASLLPQLKSFFGLLVKQAQQPAKTRVAAWSHEEREAYKEMRRDIQKAVENLALAVGNDFYPWVEEEFVSAFQAAETTGDLKKLVAICWTFRFCYSSQAATSPSFPSILEHLQRVFSCRDRDCIFQAFKALESWVPALEDRGYEGMLQSFVPIICTALAQKDAALTSMSAGTLAVLIEALPKHITAFYPQLSDKIVVCLTEGVGSLPSRGVLLKCLGRLMVKLVPNQAAVEIDKTFPVLSVMLGRCKSKQELSGILALLPGFFQVVGAETVELRLSVHAVIHVAVARLGISLLSHLHDTGVFEDTSHKLDDVCSSLMKEVLYACGPAVNDLLPAVVPIAGRFFTRCPTAAVLCLITELLTVHLNGVEYEDLFSQLCTHVFKSVINLSLQDNWSEFSDIYASFAMTAYPVIRSSASALIKLDMDWEGLLNLVIKLLIRLPLTGDSESMVQSNLILEELLRMKPRIAEQVTDFVNPIKILLENGYGIKLVHQFLSIFYDPASDEQRVKMCSDCLFVMLTEMGATTKAWIKQLPSPVVDTDSLAHMAYSRLLSTIITQRSKSSLARQIKTYRQKFRSAVPDDVAIPL
ncbi:hypothetical protein BV898_12590 [Hypsibius exemplaris]|uniref:Importin-13 n=1 Tax=Hypsibius exemplaris TaxID=2072580 RepID=A0A1W0WD83_HYPEX|nr:hypothetical protein BV898_12590 [Hypsibius exemplaris]